MIIDLDRWLTDETEREAEGRVFPHDMFISVIIGPCRKSRRRNSVAFRIVVTKWNAVLRKAGMTLVLYARSLAWSWVTSLRLVNRLAVQIR
jgi:hypothetical protein